MNNYLFFYGNQPVMDPGTEFDLIVVDEDNVDDPVELFCVRGYDTTPDDVFRAHMGDRPGGNYTIRGTWRVHDSVDPGPKCMGLFTATRIDCEKQERNDNGTRNS